MLQKKAYGVNWQFQKPSRIKESNLPIYELMLPLITNLWVKSQ